MMSMTDDDRNIYDLSRRNLDKFIAFFQWAFHSDGDLMGRFSICWN